jgi:O-antigen/teichoic acid export membrane protein
MDLLFLTASGLLCTTGHLLIDGLYDARYQDAGWILQVLAIQVGMSIMLIPAETLLFSVGKTFYGFARSLAKAVWILIGIPVGWHLAGLAGVVWCVALSEFPVLVVIWSGMIKQKLLRPVFELRSLAIWGGSALLGWLVEATFL